MHPFERLSKAVRHNLFLNNADWLWDTIRPFYNFALRRFFKRSGLVRIINGTDRVLIPYTCSSLSEAYESQVWKYLMESIRYGDIAADVGAHIGLYTVALANRVGRLGQVYAFEPDDQNFNVLKDTIFLNRVSAQVKLIESAVASRDGLINFSANSEPNAHINFCDDKNGYKVKCVKLDTIFAEKRLDILKIDVEGYEEEVLKGGANLLADPKRRPRFALIELHPFAWPVSGANSRSILNYFSGYDCAILDVNGKPVGDVEKAHWCWMIARI
ncbi:MAG: FkbM family methyltransferase [Candidatus Omnitrophica bacterium]|nr:FkbM family methyltransferase [Candidatus Omnitrophota bacterium]